MGLAYVKINQISGLKIDKKARYEVSATLSTDNSIVSPVLFDTKSDEINSYLTSGNVWMLPYEVSAKDDSISLTLFEGKKKYKKAAKLLLPLSWFPPNTVVHESYPMAHLEENENNKRKIFADILIHLSTNGADPFRAPPGQLLVKPMWVNPNAIQQQPAVGYIPNQCRPQFAQTRYNQSVHQAIPPPLGIPRIRGGPAPQVFTQPFMPPPYLPYTSQPQQPFLQQQQNQRQFNHQQMQQNQIQVNQPKSQQLQFQQNQQQVLQQKVATSKETSSSDDELDFSVPNSNHDLNTNSNQKQNATHNADLDLQANDYLSVMPITNTDHTYNPNTP